VKDVHALAGALAARSMAQNVPLAQVLDEEYLQRYYMRTSAGGKSFYDLQLECMADAELSPFQSRSLDMRVLTGQTSLFYKACAAPGAALVSLAACQAMQDLRQVHCCGDDGLLPAVALRRQLQAERMPRRWRAMQSMRRPSGSSLQLRRIRQA
jgi:hypothetical protein